MKIRTLFIVFSVLISLRLDVFRLDFKFSGCIFKVFLLSFPVNYSIKVFRLYFFRTAFT
ncbi:unnamed protein product [Meloidogyne enterolobii]|uniref:Uncharacterized protein n=1 Tax=Meloidogyne enterolobii TaxID=390850 RepID=A0ACB1ART9_MELEN